MKAYSLLFLFIPFFCFAQEDRNKAITTKPSTTDCPTWNKKSKKASKAEYFQYLRTAKPQYRSQTNSPATTDSKIQPTTVQQKNNYSEQTKEKKSILQKTEENQITSDKSPKTEKRIITISEDRNSAGSKAEEKHKEPSEKIKKQEKDPAVAAEKKVEDKKGITETPNESQSGTNEKLDEEKTKLKQKLTRLTRKTNKVRRHSNSKCPSF